MASASVLGGNVSDEIAAHFQTYDDHPDTKAELAADLVVDKEAARQQAAKEAAPAVEETIPPVEEATTEETVETEETASTGAESEATEEADDDQINTLAELAAVYETEEAEFAEHLQIEGPDGEMHSLQTAITSFREGPVESEATAAAIATHVAESRKEIDTHMQKLLETTQHMMVRIETQQNVDWDKLKEDDIHDYVARREQHDEDRAAAQRAFDAFDEEKARRGKEDEMLLDQRRQDQGRLLLRRMPSWRDDAVAKTATADMQKYLLSNGFTEADWDGLVDANQYITVWKAAQYDKSQAKLKKPGVITKLRGLPTRKTLAATTRREAPAPESAAKQKGQGMLDRLKKEGSEDAFAAFFQE